MNTTAMFVEQVLLGGLVLAVVGIGYLDAGDMQAFDGNVPVTVVLAAAILGTAYLAGILVDRVADTLLQDVERRARISMVAKQLNLEGLAEVPERDLFDEEDLRFAAYDHAGTRSVLDYHRSRIRLLRGTAVLAPTLAFALILDELASGPLWRVGAWLLPGLVVLAMASKIAPKSMGWLRGRVPPRTDDTKGIKKALIKKTKDNRKVFVAKAVVDRLVWILAAATAFVAGATWSAQVPHLAWTWIAGLVVTGVAVWAWQRVLRTYFVFLAGHARYRKNHPESP